MVSHSSDPGLLKSHVQKCLNLFLILPQFFLDPLFPAAVLLFAADPQTLSLFLILPKNFGSVEPKFVSVPFQTFFDPPPAACRVAPGRPVHLHRRYRVVRLRRLIRQPLAFQRAGEPGA